MTNQKAIEYLEMLRTEVWNEDSDGYEYAQAIDVAIESLERRCGEWIVCDAPPPTWWYECSICHKAGNVEYNFCPNCGADMRFE